MASRDLELKIRTLVEGAKDVDELKKGLRGLSNQKVGDNTRRLRRGLRDTDRSMDRLGRTTRTVTRLLGGLGLALGVGQVARMATQQLQLAETLENTADKLGLNVEELQEYRLIADEVGVAQSTLDMALQRFTRRASEAANGSGEARDALAEMGIELRDNEGRLRPTGELLRDIAEQMKNMPSQADRLRVAFKLFDSEGAALVNLLNLGTDGMDQLARKFRDTGQVLEADLNRDMADANRELDEMKRILSADFARNVAANSDSITTLAEAVSDLVGLAIEGAAELADLGEQIGYFAARVGGHTDELDRVEREIKNIDRALNGSFLSTPIEYLGKSTEELKAEREKLVAERDALRKEFGRGDPDSDTDPDADPDVGGDGESADDAEKRKNKIQAIIDKLKEQQATYGQSAQAAAIYRLELLGASEAELEQARAIADTIEQQRQSEQAQKDAAATAKQLADEKRRNVEADQQLLATMREEIELAGLSSRERVQQIAVSRLSVEATNEQRRAVEQLAGKLYDLKDAGDEAGEDMSEFAVQAARNMQTAFAQYLYDPFDEGLEGMVLGFAEAVRRMMAEALAAKALQSFFSGIAGVTTGGTSSFFATMAANVQHAGGMAGTGPTRQVSPFLFMGAPRYHAGGMAGLAADEVPAILQRGEQVLSRSEVQQRRQQQPAMSGGRLQVGLEDGLVARLIKSDEGQDALAEVVHRNPTRFGR